VLLAGGVLLLVLHIVLHILGVACRRCATTSSTHYVTSLAESSALFTAGSTWLLERPRYWSISSFIL